MSEPNKLQKFVPSKVFLIYGINYANYADIIGRMLVPNYAQC